MDAKERFNKASGDFCAFDRSISFLRRSLRKCTDYDKGDPSIGDSGTPPCYTVDDPEMCDACKERKENLPKYRRLLVLRASAKRRMLRWYSRSNV